jgi:hypothetical protein
VGGNAMVVCIFETLQNLTVAEGQVLQTGEVTRTLRDNRGQNQRGMVCTGTLDFGIVARDGPGGNATTTVTDH